MSRHRMVRNLTEDDYYDDDYDDDDDDYYDDDYQQQQQQQQYAPPPPKQKAAPVIKPKIAVAGKTATTAAVGVTKPPPGWGKPTKTTPTMTPKTKAAVAGGITKAPPGWGKPTSRSTNTVSFATTTIPNPTTTTTTTPTKKSPKGSTTTTTTTTTPTATPAASTNNHKNSRPLPPVLQNAKSQLSMVVLGHVDAGKSTLMGQLLVQTGQVTQRQATKSTNGQLAWLLDENESERARGVTMEIATKGLSLENHDLIILDAPGHADFIPVMITGAAHADVAILVVAAVTGEFEAGFDGGGQTKEHLLLARGLGVTQILVAVNKLDVEGWPQDRYEQITSQVRDYCITQQQFAPKRIRFVPLSGLTGVNVSSTDKDLPPALSKWYKGPTLLQAMNDFLPANRHVDKPMRFITTDVYQEGKSVVLRGRVIQGWTQVGDKLVVLPIGDAVTINKLDHVQPPTDHNIDDDGGNDNNNNNRLAIAMAGDTVELSFQNIDIMRLHVGNILSFPQTRPPVAKKCQAKVLVMDTLNIPIIRGAQVLFHMHSLDVPAVLTKLVATLNKKDGSILKERPRALTGGCSAIVELTMSDRMVMEPFQQCRALGRFVLRRSGDTIAVGVIEQVYTQ